MKKSKVPLFVARLSYRLKYELSGLTASPSLVYDQKQSLRITLEHILQYVQDV